MAPKNENIAQILLSRAHSPDTASRIYTEKVLQRPLHLKPTTSIPSNAQVQRRLERAAKLSKKKVKPKPLSSRQKRSLCLYDIPLSAQKYAIYEPLHQMWLGYVREVLGLDEQGDGADGKEVQIGSAMAAKLCSADYHGAEVEVVRSRCVSRVGIRGIVVKDSKFLFEVVTKGDRLKSVPKEHTVFRFTLPRPVKQVEELVVEGHRDDLEKGDTGENSNESAEEGKRQPEGKRDLIFELHGDQFIYRAVDRANRKFKTHYLPDL